MKLRHKGLAVVLATCVIAPLAATSAFAASPQANELDNRFGRLVLVDTETNDYIGLGEDLKGDREKELYDAEAEADFFDMPKVGKTFSITNLESGENLKAESVLLGGIDYAEGSILDPEFNFEVSADGAVKTSDGKYLGFDDASGRLTTTSTDRFHFAGSAASDEVSLVARVDSYDESTGEAHLSGTATSTAFDDDVRIKIGEAFVSTKYDGSWLTTVYGLKPEDKTITLVQEINGQKYDEHTVSLGEEEEVEQEFAFTDPKEGDEVTAVNGKVDFAGTGVDGTSVQLWVGNKYFPDAKVANGKWDAKGITVPDGAQRIRAKISAPGEAATNSYLNITVKTDAAAQKFAFTDPKDGDDVTAVNGKVDFAGTGVDGSSVQIWVGGKYFPDAKVADGKWEAKGITAADGNQNIRAKVTAPGQTAKNHFIDVTVKSDAAAQKFAFTDPEDGDDVTAVNGKVDFAGTGIDGSTVQIWVGGKYFPDAKVADGKWEAKGITAADGNQNIRAKVSTPGQPAENFFISVTVKTDPAAQKFEFTNPKDGDDVTAVNGKVDFAGTGVDGFSVQIWVGGKYFPDAKVADGKWEAKGITAADGNQTIRAKVSTPGQPAENFFISVTVK